MQMKRMKTLKMHTKVNHKYLTMKQLSHNVAYSDPVLKSTEGNSTEDVPIIYEPFLSKVTLDSLRVTILSTIDVVELLFQDNYKYVPTGKFNEDCIEVRNMDNIFLFLTVYYQLLRHLNFTSSYVLNFLLF